MKASIFATILALTVGASASPLVKRDDYANFFSDENCNDNGGIGVNLGNTGCLGEHGRGSVYIPRSADYTSTLRLQIWRDDGCSDQQPDATWDFTATGFCHKLNPDDTYYNFCQPGFNCYA